MTDRIFTRVIDLDPEDWAVIDLDSGTVLGTNLVLVPARNITEDVMSSDSAAHDCGMKHGRIMWTTEKV